MVAIHWHATRGRRGQRDAVLALGDAWDHAAHRTPHGQAIELTPEDFQT